MPQNFGKVPKDSEKEVKELEQLHKVSEKDSNASEKEHKGLKKEIKNLEREYKDSEKEYKNSEEDTRALEKENKVQESRDSKKELKNSKRENKDSEKEFKHSLETKVGKKQPKDFEKKLKNLEKEPLATDKEPKNSNDSMKDSKDTNTELKDSEHSGKNPKDTHKEPQTSKGSEKNTSDANKDSKDTQKEPMNSKDSGKGSSDTDKEPKGSKDSKDIDKQPKDSKDSKDTDKQSKDSKDPKKPTKDATEALQMVLTHVGDMGRYQKILFIFMLPFGVCFAFVYFVQMFITVSPEKHWCTVPELAHLDMELRRNMTAPGASNGEWDKCSTFDVNWTQVLETMTPPAPDTPTVPCKHGWTFEFTDIPYPTVVTERGWVCENSWYVPLAQATYFVGALVGGLVLGWLADHHGRVPAILCASLIGGIGGIATIFTTAAWDFTLCRFIVGMSFDNIFMMPYILIIEYVGTQYRTWAANFSIVFFGAGCLSLPWLALWLNDWRLLLWVTSLPLLLVVLAPLVFPESARWYLSRSRINEAVAVLRSFERINRNKIPDEVMEEFLEASKSYKENRESLLALLKSTHLRLTMIIMVMVYMSCAVIFDGLVRLSDAFGLDFFVTFTVTSSTEIPAVLLLAAILDIWGRRYLTAVPIFLAGVFVLIAIFVPRGIPQAAMAVLARFSINMSYNTVVQWTTELLPTTVRASGSAAMHMSGYVATVLSPYIVYSKHFWSQLPLIVLCAVALFSSIISTVLPETMGRHMPQTIAEGERVVQEQPVWFMQSLHNMKFNKKRVTCGRQSQRSP